MKILIIGSGGREHAIAWKISRSKLADKIYCAPGNGGISELAELVDIKATDIPALVAFAKKEKIDFTIVAPDDPLVLGAVDEFEKNGLAVFGPRKNAAILEGSKAFSKDLMKKYNIPTSEYELFSDFETAVEYVKCRKHSLVIKADGLALGKGVIICNSEAESIEALKEMFLNKTFGTSGDTVLIEEFMTGYEVTVLAFTDGKTIKPMVSSQDHKRAHDNNMGLNTGGMGAVAPVERFTADDHDECMQKIFIPTLNALNSEGIEYIGVIYFGLMITPDGPKVVEYNARFGDPEAQAVLSLLDTDLLEIMIACTNKSLDKIDIKWHNRYSCCVVLASGGYPEIYEKGFSIHGTLDVSSECNVFHSGTIIRDNRYHTNGGRVLGITCTGSTLAEAIENSYEEAGKISFDGMFYRKDIGRYSGKLPKNT